MWKKFRNWFARRPATSSAIPPAAAWAFAGTGNFMGTTNPAGSGNPTGTNNPAGTTNPTGASNSAGTANPTGTGNPVTPQQKSGMGVEMRIYFIALVVSAVCISISLVSSRLLKPFFVSSTNSPSPADTAVILDIGEINARTLDIEQLIQSQNQRQDERDIVSKLDQILSKLGDGGKSPAPNEKNPPNADYNPSQLDGIIKQISDLQRSIDINTAYDPAAFAEIRRKLDDLSSLIAQKMADQKQNITINVPSKTPETGVKTPEQDKARNTIGLVNVNTERH